MLRVTSLLPNPPAPAGADTGGPPRSVQTITTSLSGGAHETSNVPAAADSAPYLSEFVASSCTTIANVVADASPTPMRGTETRTLPLKAPISSYGARSTVSKSPSSAAFPSWPGIGRTRSCARPKAVSRCVSSRAISTVDVVDRDVIAVRPDAIAKRFLTRWLISPASNSWPSSACFRPVTSIKIPNMIRPTMPASSPWPRADIHRTSFPSMMRKSIS